MKLDQHSSPDNARGGEQHMTDGKGDGHYTMVVADFRKRCFVSPAAGPVLMSASAVAVKAWFSSA